MIDIQENNKVDESTSDLKRKKETFTYSICNRKPGKNTSGDK